MCYITKIIINRNHRQMTMCKIVIIVENQNHLKFTLNIERLKMSISLWNGELKFAFLSPRG